MSQDKKEWDFEKEISLLTKRYMEFRRRAKASKKSNTPVAQESIKLSDGLIAIFDKLETGFQEILDHVHAVQEEDPSLIDQTTISRISSFVEMATIMRAQHDQLVDHLSYGETLQHALEISDEQMDAFYHVAKYLYEQQLYRQSAIAFTLLSLIQPTQPLFWMGLGNSEYFIGRYREALIAYSLAIQTDDTNPLYHILSAKCHKAMQNPGGAVAALQLAIMAPTEPEKREEVRRMVEPMIQEQQ